MIREFDLKTLTWMQENADWFEIFSHILHVLVTDEGFSVLCPLLLWFTQPMSAIRVLVLSSLQEVSNGLIKWTFQFPRPFWVVSPLKNTGKVWEQDFSFPSSHAQTTASIGTMILLTFPHWNISILVTILIFLTGISRVYRGVHFPTCVMTGWGVGILEAHLMHYYDPIGWFIKQPAAMQYTTAFAVFAGLYFLLAAVRVLVPDRAASQLDRWSRHAIANTAGTKYENKAEQISTDNLLQPRRLCKYHMQIGSLLGCLIGLSWALQESRDATLPFMNENCDDHRLAQCGRCLIGFVGAALLVVPFGFVIPKKFANNKLLANVSEIFGFTLLGLWCVYLTPKISNDIFGLACPLARPVF
jgi:membrane-associated phospholipid phosphatase